MSRKGTPGRIDFVLCSIPLVLSSTAWIIFERRKKL